MRLANPAGFKVNTGVGLFGRCRIVPSEVFNGFSKARRPRALTDFLQSGDMEMESSGAFQTNSLRLFAVHVCTT